MKNDLNRLFVYKQVQPASLAEFVDFWSSRYYYPNETWYDDNIKGPHTREGLIDLFKWKMDPRFRVVKMPLVEGAFLSRFDEAKGLKTKHAKVESRIFARSFLSEFGTGGPIWRIFWLHCWDNRCPIFDQHVYRAMTYIEDGVGKELPAYEPKVVDLYLARFFPFFEKFIGIDGRKVDKALFQFGKEARKSTRPNNKTSGLSMASVKLA